MLTAHTHTSSHIHTCIHTPGMQDWKKTLEIYNEALYPRMRELGLRDLVEDNASPHNNDKVRESHRANGIRIVGYTANEDEKEEVRRLIEVQTRAYRCARAHIDRHTHTYTHTRIQDTCIHPPHKARPRPSRADDQADQGVGSFAGLASQQSRHEPG